MMEERKRIVCGSQQEKERLRKRKTTEEKWQDVLFAGEREGSSVVYTFYESSNRPIKTRFVRHTTSAAALNPIEFDTCTTYYTNPAMGVPASAGRVHSFA
jgi:hypothetical protein